MIEQDELNFCLFYDEEAQSVALADIKKEGIIIVPEQVILVEEVCYE